MNQVNRETSVSESVRVREMVESFLHTQGIDSFEAHVDDDMWVFRRGSASGHIALIEDEEEPEWSRLYVSFAVMKVPLSRALRFYRRLLEINDELGGTCSFSVDSTDVVWLSAGRKIEGLDLAELNELVMRTGFYADRYDDMLLDEYGREHSYR
ncbi:hypothetical protein BH24GEM3_BH24GEM3_02940 [soil metagenome]